MNALEDVPYTVCCLYTPGVDLTQCALGMERGVLRKTLSCVAEALVFCHRRRIVHLDVKPENVVVASSGEVKLIDFEYAQEIPIGESSIRLTHRCGTLGYVAPEILEGGTAYFASDVWSFGCLIMACCGHMIHIGYPEKIQRRESFPICKSHYDYHPILSSTFSYEPDHRIHMLHILGNLK